MNTAQGSILFQIVVSWLRITESGNAGITFAETSCLEANSKSMIFAFWAVIVLQVFEINKILAKANIDGRNTLKEEINFPLYSNKLL